MKKYHKVNKEDYEKRYGEHQAYRDRVKSDPNRPAYHLTPETGWPNDPNGLRQLHGLCHTCYQHTLSEPTDEIKLWGHYTTKDFVRYTNEEPVLFPDHDFDAHGVYSGSALAEDGTIHYFYTGNVKRFDRGGHDYIMSERESNTIYLGSRDGYEFPEKTILITDRDYPTDMSCHIRDPKVFCHGSAYYIAPGTRGEESKGVVLSYRSKSLKNQEYYNRVTTKAPFGYMWECPNLFWLDDQLCLICCPQGVAPRGVDFWSIYQCTVMELDYDFGANTYRMNRLEDNQEKISIADRGFDSYAPQTFEDETGKRILIGRMRILDADYTNPTTQAGWQHALIIPRVLHWAGGRPIQTSVEKLKYTRYHGRTYDLGQLNETGEKEIVYEACFQFGACGRAILTLRAGATSNYGSRPLTLNIGGKGNGRANRSVMVGNLRELRVFFDTSSLEVSVNGREEVSTARVYRMEGGTRADRACSGCVGLYDLSGFIYE